MFDVYYIFFQNQIVSVFDRDRSFVRFRSLVPNRESLVFIIDKENNMKCTLSKNLTLIFIPVLFFCISCSGVKKPDDLPDLFPTTITILQEGQPVADATVNLLPEGNSKWFAGGKTDAQGKCIIRTQGKYDGTPAGKFNVVVYKTVTQESETRKQPEPTDPVEAKAYYDKIAKEEKIHDFIDLKYKKPTTTDLKLEITSGMNEQTYDVGKPVKIEFIPLGM